MICVADLGHSGGILPLQLCHLRTSAPPKCETWASGLTLFRLVFFPSLEACLLDTWKMKIIRNHDPMLGTGASTGLSSPQNRLAASDFPVINAGEV